MLPWQTTQFIRFYTISWIFCLLFSYFCFFYIVYPVFKTDPTATEHAEEVDARVRGGDREDETDAGAPLYQLLQTPSDLRCVLLLVLEYHFVSGYWYWSYWINFNKHHKISGYWYWSIKSNQLPKMPKITKS